MMALPTESPESAGKRTEGFVMDAILGDTRTYEAPGVVYLDRSSWCSVLVPMRWSTCARRGGGG
jgi:hypothetical protein